MLRRPHGHISEDPRTAPAGRRPSPGLLSGGPAVTAGPITALELLSLRAERREVAARGYRARGGGAARPLLLVAHVCSAALWPRVQRSPELDAERVQVQPLELAVGAGAVPGIRMAVR